MKNTGILRPIDNLGRVSLPKELRDVLGMKNGSMVEIWTADSCVVVKAHSSTDSICSTMRMLTEQMEQLEQIDRAKMHQLMDQLWLLVQKERSKRYD